MLCVTSIPSRYSKNYLEINWLPWLLLCQIPDSSDQGYVDVLKVFYDLQPIYVNCSMSHARPLKDNAPMESINGWNKAELLYRFPCHLGRKR